MKLVAAEWHAPSVEDLPIKRCQKLGIVMDVASEVLGETVVFAPTAKVEGETRVVYTWREAFILAKAQPEGELLRYVHELKRQFPGSVIETITVSGSGKHADVKMSGQPAVVPEAPQSLQANSYWDAQDRTPNSKVKRTKVDVLANRGKKRDGKKSAPSQSVPIEKTQPTLPPALGPQANDVYLVDEPQLLTGPSLASLLPRRPSQ